MVQWCRYRPCQSYDHLCHVPSHRICWLLLFENVFQDLRCKFFKRLIQIQEEINQPVYRLVCWSRIRNSFQIFFDHEHSFCHFLVWNRTPNPLSYCSVCLCHSLCSRTYADMLLLQTTTNVRWQDDHEHVEYLPMGSSCWSSYQLLDAWKQPDLW